MLSDAQIERYSRQIVLPEVGGRGQERVLAARVAMVGEGPALEFAARLLARAGVGTLTGDGGPADVTVEVGDACARAAFPAGGVHVLGLAGGARLVVATVTGRPCAACAPVAQLLEPGAGDDWITEGSRRNAGLGAPEALALGALLAGEALGALWRPAVGARVQVLDLSLGRFTGRSLARTAGCRLCRERP